MELFKFINLIDERLKPETVKIHLAGWNGEDNPLDVYLAGDFEYWQSFQTKKNFEREYIVSLIQLPMQNQWLFAGSYTSCDVEYNEEFKCYKYKTRESLETQYLSGRLVVHFKRSGRASYLLADNWPNEFYISEIYPEKIKIKEFDSFNSTSINKSTLDIIVRQNITSWRVALSAINGVYVITDTSNGKLYVGSASGFGGIWQRWCDYSSSGHGGNIELVKILAEQGHEYAYNFQYTILEVCDTNASQEYILSRESYWKDALATRAFGYNSN